MQKFIWYNPEVDQYQLGTKDEFEKKKSSSSQSGAFEIEYRLSELSQKLAHQIIQRLNSKDSVKLAN